MIRHDDLEKNVDETECIKQWKSAENWNPNSETPNSGRSKHMLKKLSNVRCFVEIFVGSD